MTLTGTGSIDTGSRLIRGNGTLFTSELTQGDAVTLGDFSGIIDHVSDDITAKVKESSAVTVTNATITKN